MSTTEDRVRHKTQFSTGTRVLANICHKCGICPFADKKPQSRFGTLMRWHRTWCPAWTAHTKVYGRKPVS